MVAHAIKSLTDAENEVLSSVIGSSLAMQKAWCRTHKPLAAT